MEKARRLATGLADAGTQSLRGGDIEAHLAGNERQAERFIGKQIHGQDAAAALAALAPAQGDRQRLVAGAVESVRNDRAALDKDAREGQAALGEAFGASDILSHTDAFDGAYEEHRMGKFDVNRDRFIPFGGAGG